MLIDNALAPPSPRIIMASAPDNLVSHLPFGTHFHTIHSIPVVSSHRIAVYNSEGIRRCYKCLCLVLRAVSHQRTCQGPRKDKLCRFSCLVGCGRAFSTAAYAGSHSSACDGVRIPTDRYGTYKCPKCEVAGFAEKAIRKHIAKCSGQKADTLKSYRGDSPVRICQDCGGSFLDTGLHKHTCHVFGDPVWLGRQDEPPNLAMTYVRWCRQHDLTLGGVPGRMPEVIPDETVSEACYVSPHGHQSTLDSSTNDDTDDDSADSECDSDLGSDSSEREELEGHGEDGKDGDECDVSGGGEGDGEEGKSYDQALLEAHQMRMRLKLRGAEVTFDKFDDTVCDGITWRHGYFPCPYDTLLTAETAYFRLSIWYKGKPQVQIMPYCFRCAYLRRRISRWVRESKYTVGGVHLCRKTGCRAPVAAIWHCRYHADQTARRGIRNQRRLGTPKVAPPRVIAELTCRNPAMKKLVCPRWTMVRRAVHGDATASLPPVFFVDTESVYDTHSGGFLVCEIAVRSAANRVLLCTLVDHGLTYSDLRSRVKPNMYAKLLGLYGFDDRTSCTHGMTPDRVAARLVEIGMSSSALMVEWSLNGFDLRAMRHTFDAAVLPSTALLGHRLWRDIGLPGSVALLPLFASAFKNSLLNRTHHRADVDTEKLFLMVEKSLKCFS